MKWRLLTALTDMVLIGGILLITLNILGEAVL